MIVATTPLTPESFAPYGQVIMADKGVPEYVAWIGHIGNLRPEAKLNVTFMSFAPADYPARMTKFERHPFSHQMFVPLERTNHLVVVCSALENGDPDLATIKAFHASGGQTVIYTANVWHTPRTILYESGSFIMLRWDAGTRTDTEFFNLDQPFEVDYPRTNTP